MCRLFMYSAQMYFRNTEKVKGFIKTVSFPTWAVIALSVANILGVIAVLTNLNPVLKKWTYAGSFFDVILAAGGHYYVGH